MKEGSRCGCLVVGIGKIGRLLFLFRLGCCVNLIALVSKTEGIEVTKKSLFLHCYLWRN